MPETGIQNNSAVVMFVDDEPSVLSSLRRLCDDSSYRCEFFQSPEHALEFARENEVALVVSDNQMPVMTGIEFLARMRLVSPDTVRVMMTAYANLGVAISAINQSEAFRFITKPWDNNELLSLIDEGVARHNILSSMKSRD